MEANVGGSEDEDEGFVEQAESETEEEEEDAYEEEEDEEVEEEDEEDAPDTRLENHSLEGMVHEGRHKQFQGSYEEASGAQSEDEDEESKDDEVSDDESFGNAKKKKVVRRPMAKKGAAAVPKRKRGEAKSAAKKKIEAKEPKFNASAYLPMRETRTGNMQIDRKAYADSDSDSDDFGGAADADADANADDDDSDDDDDNAPKKKRKNAAMRKKVGPVKPSPEQLVETPDTDEIDRVLDQRERTLDEMQVVELWVKWKGFSHLHNTWEDRERLMQLPGAKRVANFQKKMDQASFSRHLMTPEEQESADVALEMEKELQDEYVKVERVVAERDDFEAGLQYLVKWRGLPYSECTWESASDDGFMSVETTQPAIDAFMAREARALMPAKGVDQQRKHFNQSGGRALVEQPLYLQFGKLRDYQLDGLNWLIYSWASDKNGILADEMGLGKTIQCAAMLGYLLETQKIPGPFLIVVPLSVVPNWIRELNRWCPALNTIVYVGDGDSREVIRHFEWNKPNSRDGSPKFHALLTTYELVLKDSRFLASVKWSYLMVDEAHRLKNTEAALYKELQTFHAKNKLLVTGTPLQNSIKELFSLLHFLEPQKFSDLKEFEERHSIQDAEGVASLHAELKPHLLRRVIKDVEKSMPPKKERVLRVQMTPLQKRYYKWILKRNYADLNKGARGSGAVSLLNIVMELKKCCNHPFLFESAEFGYGADGSSASSLERSILASGKLALLDKLLVRLKADGHRVLIFSQMVRMLNILSSYLTQKGYVHQRLDGSMPAAKRHHSMEHFNAPNSPDFAFLLSTRAGGLGINLATADTVIIFDSDWNPQNDLQAMSRAHRIGQKDTVNIYRLVTSGSVEEDILEKAKAKLVLDHLVIQRMDTSGRTVIGADSSSVAKKMFSKEDFQKIVRFGAEGLFAKSEGEEGSAPPAADDADNAVAEVFGEEDLDEILARADRELPDDNPTERDGASDLLDAFKVASFGTSEDDATFWNRLIGAEVKNEQAKEEVLLPRAARMHEVSYREVGGVDGRAPRGASGATRGSRTKDAVGDPIPGALVRIVEWPGVEGEEDPPPIGRREGGLFAKAALRFGRKDKLVDVAKEVGGNFEGASEALQLRLWMALDDGCRQAISVSKAANSVSKTDPVVDFFGSEVKASAYITRVEEHKLLAAEMSRYSQPATQFRLPRDALLKPPGWVRAIPGGWDSRDDALLLIGVFFHGAPATTEAWQIIVADPALQLKEKLKGLRSNWALRTGQGLTQEENKEELVKASHIISRVNQLLRRIKELAQQGNARARKVVGKPKGVERVGPGARQPESRADAPGGKATGGLRAFEKNSKTDMALVRPTLTDLRDLQDAKDLPAKETISKTKQYLSIIGAHIDRVVGAGTEGRSEFRRRAEAELWEYVAEFSNLALSGERISGIYAKLKEKKIAATAGLGAAKGSATTAHPS